MELVLPQNSNHKETHITTSRLVVIGTNGIGKSSFGKELARRYPNKAVILAGLHALFINYIPESQKNTESWLQLQTLLQERMSIPHITEYEKLIIQLQQEEFEEAVNFKESCKKRRDCNRPSRSWI